MTDQATGDDRDVKPYSPEIKQELSRREFLLRAMRAGAGAVAGAALATGGLAALTSLGRRPDGTQATPVASGAALTSVPDDRSLAAHAAANGLTYGAATVDEYLENDADFAAHFADECSVLVPESELKWLAIRPSRNRYDFSKADKLASFATRHNMLMRGHTLVWHNALPDWLGQVMKPSNAAGILHDHISKVVGRYAGQIYSWDVVNEVINPDDNQPDQLRKSIWLANYGPHYIEDAFKFAAEADPNAMLVYNEYGLEYDVSADHRKRDAVLALLTRLKSRGVPVHALGMQAHLQADQMSDFNPDVLRSFIRHVGDLGLKVLITELDVTDRTLPANVAARDQAVAEIYSTYLGAALQEQAVSAVLTWGLSDRYTWLMHEPQRPDLASPRPLPLDGALQRKPAWYAMASAFDNAPPRSPGSPRIRPAGLIPI